MSKVRSSYELPFYSLAEVVRLTAIPAAKLKNMVLKGQFPRPIPIAGAGMWVWSGSEVECWRQKVFVDSKDVAPCEAAAAFEEASQ